MRDQIAGSMRTYTKHNEIYIWHLTGESLINPKVPLLSRSEVRTY